MAVLMPVVPQLRLVEQKEKHQPHEQSGKEIVGARLALKRLGQQVHERSGQQGTGRQTQKVLWAHAVATATQAQAHEQLGQPYAANTGGQSGQNDCYQCHSQICFMDKRWGLFSFKFFVPGAAPKKAALSAQAASFGARAATAQATQQGQTTPCALNQASMRRVPSSAASLR